VDRCRGPVEQALKDAKLSPSDIDEVVLVGGSTRIPAVQELVKSLTGGKEPHQGVNPDEVVAIGAAIQAGVLAGEVKDIVLLDVTPLSVGIETLGGVMTKLVERNTTIPVRRSEVFSTADDNQGSVDVDVLQGERPMARDNKSLGNFRLEGIMPAPRGVPKIEVTFDIDANGILNVAAKDQATGKEQKITITNTSNLNDDEITQMVKDAEAHRSEDEKLKQQIEQKNQADNLCHSAEKMLKDLGDKVPDAEKSTIQQQIDDLRAAIHANDADKTKALYDTLQQSLYTLSTKAYEQAGGAEAGAGPAAGDSQPDEDIIDAEFRPSDEGVGAR